MNDMLNFFEVIKKAGSPSNNFSKHKHNIQKHILYILESEKNVLERNPTN